MTSIDNAKTVAETAETLGFSERTIYQYIKDGRLKAYKWGRTWRITQEAIDDFVRQTTGGATEIQTETTTE